MTGIDVAIPCYNYGRYLRTAVASVLAQDVAGLRVLVIDNASTDDSVEVARQLAAEDGRVEVVVRSQNLGPHASYNAGIDWAASDYFLLLDADDAVPRGALARAVGFLDANPGVVLCHGAERLHAEPGDPPLDGESDEPTMWRTCSGRRFIERFAERPENFIGATTVVRRTAAQKAAGHYRSSLPFTDDLEMWLRMAMLGDVAETSALQGIRRVHPRQATEQYRRRPIEDFHAHLDAFESFFAREGTALAGGQAIRMRIRRKLGINAYWFGRWRLDEGDRSGGEECISLGLRLNPLAVAPRLAKGLLLKEIPRASAPALLRAAAEATSGR